MDINNDLLSKILSGDSSSKVAILNWHIENNIAPGSNHSSELSRLTVEYQKKGKTFKKSFVLKIPSTHRMYRTGMKFKMYEKEYPVYTEVLEEMYKIDGEHIGPRLYYADDKHSLMMKDLSSSGYKMVDRIKQLDFDQCSLVLKKIAKFHGLSVKLNQDSKLKSSIKEIYWTKIKLNESYAKFPRVACEQLAKSVDAKFNLYEKILRFKDDLYEKLCQELTSNRFKFKVLNHGDLWLGNTLFKFDKYGNVEKVKLIDFQTVSWTSPAIDILLFTLSSMQFEIFEKYFHKLMETYIETLNNTLRFFQCGSYSLQQLYDDMNNLPATIIMFLGSRLPILLSSYENLLEVVNYTEDGSFDCTHYGKLFQNEIYLKVVNRWISYYAKKGLFD